MKIAIASSGLGHVTRGMEAWAEYLAKELSARGIDITLFKGAGPATNPYDVVLRTFRRNRLAAKAIGLVTSKGGWRFGLGAPHAVESFFYGAQLLYRVRKSYDLVHVQQGSLAELLCRSNKLGLLKIPFIFANGQKADSEFLQKFRYVQFLSPFDRIPCDREKGKGRFVIPNFVSTETFTPGDRASARKKFGLEDDRFIVLTVGMIDKSVKRMDYFIREAHKFKMKTNGKITFIMAGSECKESPEVLSLGRRLLGENLIVLKDLEPEKMPTLYRSADVFVLCSYREAFGLVIAEAMSCGLPAICHDFQIIKWVVGSGGECVDLSRKDSLMDKLEMYYRDRALRRKTGEKGRRRVQEMFSSKAVIDDILGMYRKVICLDKMQEGHV